MPPHRPALLRTPATRIAAFVVLICFLFGYSAEDDSQKIDLSVREPVSVRANDPETLSYAYLPQYSHSVAYQRHHMIVEYLKKSTGLKIKQVFPDTFDEHLRMVAHGKIDISFSNPLVFIKMSQRGHARAFARVVEKYGDADFRGSIICRADNPGIRTLADCVGKKWIAVDPGSAGGYLYPLGLFIKNGISPDDFAEISFAPGPGGKQEKVVLAVYAGKYDVGSVREGTLDLLQSKIDITKIRVVAHTGWYPGWVYAARRNLAPAIVEAIRTALIALDYQQPEGHRLLERARLKGIIASRDEDFDAVRRLWETMQQAEDGGSDDFLWRRCP